MSRARTALNTRVSEYWTPFETAVFNAICTRDVPDHLIFSQRLLVASAMLETFDLFILERREKVSDAHSE